MGPFRGWGLSGAQETHRVQRGEMTQGEHRAGRLISESVGGQLLRNSNRHDVHIESWKSEQLPDRMHRPEV